MHEINFEKLKEIVKNAESISYWDHKKKAIILFKSELCWHVSMDRNNYNELLKIHADNAVGGIIYKDVKRAFKRRTSSINWSRLVELYKNGYEYKDIARMLNCEVCSVVRKVSEYISDGIMEKRLGGAFKSSDSVKSLLMMIDNEFPFEFIAQQFGVSKSTINKKARMLRGKSEK